MPSGFTHILLAKTFTEKSNLVDHELGLLLAENMKYFQLGALGPDLPYSQLMGLTNRGSAKLADKFHYIKTNNIPIRAFYRIKSLAGDEKDQSFAFFLGYCCHVVADGIIHPFIRDKVGDYSQNQTAHRTLEMRIDVLFLNELTKLSGHAQNLNYTNLHDQILDPLSKKFDHISSLFSRLIFEIYGDKISKEEIEEWVKDMHKVLETAENENNQFYAKLPILKDYLFKDLASVLENSENDILLKVGDAKGREINFAGRDIHFFNDCLPSFYNAFKNVAIDAFDFVYNDGTKFTNTSFPGINLDTGRPLLVADGNDLNSKASFWEIA